VNIIRLRSGRCVAGVVTGLAGAFALWTGTALGVDAPSAPAPPAGASVPSLRPVPTLPAAPAPASPAPAPTAPAPPQLRPPVPAQLGPGTSAASPFAGGSHARTAARRGASPTARAAEHGAGASPRASRRSRLRAARSERRLRRLVRRLSGCFGALTAFERRVLLLRTGIGAGRPHSRARVAARLRASRHRVLRAERSGIGRLRRAARSGACGGQAGAPGGGREAGPTPVSQRTTFTLAAATPVGARLRAIPVLGEVLAAEASSGDKPPAGRPAGRARLAVDTASGDPPGPVFALLILAGFATVVLAFVAATRLRERSAPSWAGFQTDEPASPRRREAIRPTRAAPAELYSAKPAPWGRSEEADKPREPRKGKRSLTTPPWSDES
jgi:hypothetical protein